VPKSDLIHVLVFRHFGDLFYKLLMEKLQFYALMPFMLYMPYSALFVQENTSKDQK
jgi:hypothetical protein